MLKTMRRWVFGPKSWW